jgi:hypothetical protein
MTTIDLGQVGVGDTMSLLSVLSAHANRAALSAGLKASRLLLLGQPLH